MIKLTPLTLIGGHYGSGKTEIAVNLAVYANTIRANVVLADLDIVNPYFRSHEQSQPLQALGIKVLTGALGGKADLPALPAELNSLFAGQADTTTIVDLGGDPVGAHVLARYHDLLDEIDFEFFLVLNANRPETRSVSLAKAMLEEIETTSRQKITGIINNTHLIDETSIVDCLAGHKLARDLSAATAIPYVFTAAPAHLMLELEKQVDVPILPIKRFMLKPWESDKLEGEQYEWLHE